MRTKAIAAGLGSIIALTCPAAALDLTPEALAKLSAGEPVTAFVVAKEESAAGNLEAVIDIQAPPPVVWKILTDCDLNLKVFNGLKGCRIVSQEADGLGDVREHTISLSRLLPSLRSVFKSRYDAGKTITFEKTEGDLKRLAGTWRLEPLPDGTTTRLHYKADIAVGVALPSSLIKAALESDMPKTMRSIRKVAMAGLGG